MMYPGYVSWLRSKATGREFPIFVFSADTDMATNGLISFTSADGNELILSEVTSVEWSHGEAAGEEECRQRINLMLNRDDLRVIHLIRRESENRSGIDFADFRKNYKSPRLFYVDLFSSNGEAEQIRNEEVEAFLSRGGKIIRV